MGSENGVCLLELTDTEETRKMWPFTFRAEYRIELLEDRLRTTLQIQNPVKSPSTEEFFFTTALHSYFAVGNIEACKIEGEFQGSQKIDKTETPPKVTKGASDTLSITIHRRDLQEHIAREGRSAGSF